jgi:hypothetical protein
MFTSFDNSSIEVMSVWAAFRPARMSEMLLAGATTVQSEHATGEGPVASIVWPIEFDAQGIESLAVGQS